MPNSIYEKIIFEWMKAFKGDEKFNCDIDDPKV
jgi:hypothetical protein